MKDVDEPSQKFRSCLDIIEHYITYYELYYVKENVDLIKWNGDEKYWIEFQ